MNETHILVVVLGLTLAALLLNKLLSFNVRMPYKHRHILTKTEYAFWCVLRTKVADYDLLICPKVRMEDFLSVDIKNEKRRQSWRGKIKSRHIDFILCDKDMKMLAGVELDDASHNQKEAIQIDKFKNKVFETIGLPLFRVTVNEGAYPAQIDGILRALHLLERE